MQCPVCRQRTARRACPALGQPICSVCCGTKRLVEIQCPSDCGYLSTARGHPAAVVRRQQERDVAAILPTLSQLTERQHQLFFVLQSVIARHTPEGFTRLCDDDVAEAAGAIAATLETSARGVLFDHTPESLPARALAAEIKRFLEEIGKKAGTGFEREAIPVLRSIERGARDTRLAVQGGGGTAYLTVMGRLLHETNRAAAPAAEDSKARSPLILP